jgi:hypothetical protein
MNNVVLFVIGGGIAILAIYLLLANKLKLNETSDSKSEQEVANEMTEEILMTETKRSDYNEDKEVGKD